jgi:integrase
MQGTMGDMGMLTAAAIRGLKPKAKKYRKFDGKGLFIEVLPTGRKVWRMKYRIDGREKDITFGPWSVNSKPGHLTAKEARLRATKAHALLDEGKDPSVTKKLDRAQQRAREGQSFREMGDAWVKDEAGRMQWTTKHELSVSRSLERHLYPVLGDLPVSEIRAAHVFPIIESLVRLTPSTADKIEQRVRAILDFAVYSGVVEINPLPAKRRTKKGRNYPAIVDIEGLRLILSEAEAADASHGVRRAHLLLAFTVQRVGEVVNAEWDEFDLEGGLWTIPRAKMKQKDTVRPDQVVPIPEPLLYEMRRWRDVSRSEWICEGPRNGKPVTATAVEKFYREKLGYRGKHSPHSWRSAFSTIMHDMGCDHGVIEAQLDHVVKGVAGVYDRGQRIDMRRDLMQRWAEELIG